MVTRAVILGLLLVGASVALAGCGPASGGGQPDPPVTANPWQRTAMWVEQEGQPRPFQNGTRLAMGELAVEIFVAPYPPLREGSIDLFLTDATGSRPVEGDLQIAFDMYMPHGSIRAAAIPTGGGHYLIPYKLVMPGEWRVAIVITHQGQPATLALIFRVE